MLGVDCEAIEAAYQTLWLGGEFALLRCLTYTACLTVATRNPLCRMLSLHGRLEGHPSTQGLLPSFVPFFKPAHGCSSQPPKSTPTMPALGSSASDLNSWNECIFRTGRFRSRFLTFSNIRLRTSLSLPNSWWQNVLLISGRLIKNVHLCTQLARVKLAMISQASQLKSCLMNFWNKMSLSFKTSIISDNEALN